MTHRVLAPGWRRQYLRAYVRWLKPHARGVGILMVINSWRKDAEEVYGRVGDTFGRLSDSVRMSSSGRIGLLT